MAEKSIFSPGPPRLPWIPLRSPASLVSSELTTAASVAPVTFLRAFKWVLPMNPRPKTAIRISFQILSFQRNSGENENRGGMNAIVTHLFSVLTHLGMFGLLIFGVL